MISDLLKKAREYELEKEKNISNDERPIFHLIPRVGWMNDPNGFSYYDGQFHMFYQYHPYRAVWGPMHWGHAVSKDLLHWENLPTVMAPDKFYDNFGCFSGNAITTKDGKHLLMYTSVMTRETESGDKKEYQQQAIAIGDGKEYVKYEANPVISTSQLPEGYSIVDFRDPKIWLGTDNIYRVLIGAKDLEGLGALLLYTSTDCIHWNFKKVFLKNDGNYGKMWECPDFFQINGKGVVIVSPQDMLPEGFEYHNGNGTVCFIGNYDEETDTFEIEKNQCVDYGIDFYAPETIHAPDGRHIMIGWMQNWDTTPIHNNDDKYFGQMSLPRELSIIDGRLYQKPIKEIESFRKNVTKYENVEIKNQTISLKNISGRYIDMEIEVFAEDKESLYDMFIMSFAKNEKYHTDFIFRPKESIVKLDRKFSGSRRAVVHQRRTRISSKDGSLRARIIMDRNSIEIFFDDGRQTMTTTIFTELDAQEITFEAIGSVKMNITKYDL